VEKTERRGKAGRKWEVRNDARDIELKGSLCQGKRCQKVGLLRSIFQYATRKKDGGKVTRKEFERNFPYRKNRKDAAPRGKMGHPSNGKNKRKWISGT